MGTEFLPVLESWICHEPEVRIITCKVNPSSCLNCPALSWLKFSENMKSLTIDEILFSELIPASFCISLRNYLQQVDDSQLGFFLSEVVEQHSIAQ